MKYSGLVTQEIFCCDCGHTVTARLTNGSVIYPHRPDLYNLPFWICPVCQSYVGCHHKTDQPHRPLGVLTSGEIKWVKREIHRYLDLLWSDGSTKRAKVYGELSRLLGYNYHTGEIRSMEEGRRILEVVKTMVEQKEQQLLENTQI